MATTDWDLYEIVLSPSRARAAAAPRAPAVRPAQSPSCPLASRSDRLLAALLDSFITLGVVIALLLVRSWEAESPALSAVGLGIRFFVVPMVLVVQVALLSLYGQTLGKRALGIRIVRSDDGSNPGFVHAVVLRHLLPGLICAIPLVGPLFRLFDLLNIFGEERCCLHDVLAGTKVVDC
jgi:uncharacterized RDD family membrane protein YckC